MLSELKVAYPIQGEVTLDMITRLPGLVAVSTSDLSAEESDLIARKMREATSGALVQLKQMRITEGQSLFADMDRRLSSIGRHLKTILAHTKDCFEHYR